MARPRVDYASGLPADQRHPLGPPDPDGCVVVCEVEPGSPAAASLLQVGMFISRVDNVPVRTPREFRAAVTTKTGNVSLRLWTTGEQPDIRTIKPKAE